MRLLLLHFAYVRRLRVLSSARTHTMKRTEIKQKRWLTFTYVPETMVNKPWLSDNEQLAESYSSFNQAEITIEYAKAFGITDSLQIEPVPTNGRECTDTQFRIATVQAEQPRTWRNQFPAEVAVPPEIDTLVTQSILDDTSWGNDTCASFRFAGYENDFDARRLFNRGELKPSLYSLWVDYPAVERREFGDRYKRFVLFYDRPTDADAGRYDDTYDPRRFDSYDDKFEYVIFETDDTVEMVNAITERFFQEYVWTGGTTCPWPDCESGHVESYARESLSFDSEGMDNHVRCNECGRDWTELYRLVSISVDEGERQFATEGGDPR
jgi:hypothetical protein